VPAVNPVKNYDGIRAGLAVGSGLGKVVPEKALTAVIPEFITV
jgi:hypothetical protein